MVGFDLATLATGCPRWWPDAVLVGDDEKDRRRSRAACVLDLDSRQVYCHCDAMAVTKDERLQIRVDPAEKRLLERAAEASHISVSAFVLQSAAAQAAEVLAERPLIELSPEAAAAFTEALDAPATVNQRLASGLQRPRKFRWLG